MVRRCVLCIHLKRKQLKNKKLVRIFKKCVYKNECVTHRLIASMSSHRDIMIECWLQLFSFPHNFFPTFLQHLKIWKNNTSKLTVTTMQNESWFALSITHTYTNRKPKESKKNKSKIKYTGQSKYVNKWKQLKKKYAAHTLRILIYWFEWLRIKRYAEKKNR